MSRNTVEIFGPERSRASDRRMEIAERRERFGWEMARAAATPEDGPIAKVFGAVAREEFVGPPPWRIFSGDDPGETVTDPALLYRDVLVQLKGEAAINNGQPSLHAMCFAVLRVRPGETVVHVGAGT